MNREERRKLKKLQQGIQHKPTREKCLKEGQTVKLDFERIKSHPDYKRLTVKYRNWIELHKNDIFTVEYDEQHKDHILVCLKEDSTKPKWLFYEGDLIEEKE